MKWFTLVRKLGGFDKFDENGQVFTEWYISAPDRNDQNWDRQCHSVREEEEESNISSLPAEDAGLPITDKGARSLQDIAVGSTLHNITHIPLEDFEAMPTWLVDRLWDEVVRSSYVSLEIWKKFSILLQSRKEITVRAMRYREAMESPKSPLKVYAAPLTSISYDFITYLSITSAFSAPELVKISEISNLGVLEIVKTSEMGSLLVGDRLIRAWSVAASEEGAFGVLRILRLWNFRGVTNRSLEFVSKFPVLGIYDARGCGFDGSSPVNARQLGWTVLVDPNILHTVASAVRSSRGHNIDLYEVDHATAKQPWDGTKVRGKDVDAFLVKSCNKELDPPEQQPGGTKYRLKIPQGIPGKVTTRTFQHPDELFYGVGEKEKAWDYHLSSTYAQLGALRADKDISGRGIKIRDQAVVCGDLDVSIPMVSLRLGKHLPELKLETRYLAAHSPGPAYSVVTSRPELNTTHICFIRLELPQVSEQDKNKGPAANDRVSKRKNVSAITERKKMKLSDVLGSFL